MRTFVGKGIKEPSEKIEVMKGLDIITLLEPLAQTEDEEFRAGLGVILAVYGGDLIALSDDVSPDVNSTDLSGGSPRNDSTSSRHSTASRLPTLASLHE